jgi:hypothetical protein
VRADDPRHGKLAGYRAGCHEQCCRKAANDHTQRLKLRGEYGKRHVDATGTRRRVQALAAIGWSHANVSRYIGWEGTFLAQAMRTRGKVHVDTAAAVRKAYDDLSMKLPPQTTTSERMSVARTLKLAERQGWLPPLSYDDGRIDDPDYRPHAGSNRRHRDDVDDAVVLRVLSGERLDTTPAERAEVVRRWLASGRSERQLCQITGWRMGRYTEREEVA